MIRIGITYHARSELISLNGSTKVVKKFTRNIYREAINVHNKMTCYSNEFGYIYTLVRHAI